MQIKFSKQVKKVLSGVIASSIVVALLIIFGSSQNELNGSIRKAAESLENIFYDQFSKNITDENLDAALDGDYEITDGDIATGSAKIKLANNYDPNILIVDIDEPALAKLGPYNEWDRFIHADVVKNLNNGGASAIGFDIMFKTADFGKLKTKQVRDLLHDVNDTENWDSLDSKIRSYYNYDSMLVSSVADGGVSIVCDMFDDSKAYKFESQWRPLSTEERAAEVGYGSTFNLEQVDHPEFIEPKDLLDNVFPELANAGAKLGSVNAYPDNDGVVRRVSMLYRFPNPEIYPDADVKLYSTMSLMTILHLFHQDPKNVEIKTGKYINLGKPFGIYKDQKGEMHTTYPNFSYPMFKELKKRLSEKDIKKKASLDFQDISSKVIATRLEEGNVNFEIFEGQVLSDELSRVLLDVSQAMLDSAKAGNEITIHEGFTLKADEEGANRYIITDEDNDDEAVITDYIVNTLDYFKDSLQNLPINKPVHLSLDMDLHFSKTKKAWMSNIAILSDIVIREIQATNEKEIDALKPGQELRFGREKKVPINKYGSFRVNYKGKYNTEESKRTFQHLSYYDVTKNRIDPGLYQGKIFILGSAAPALFDFVSATHEENYPAVLIHATIIKNILEDDYLVVMDDQKQAIIIMFLALLCVISGLYFKGYFSAAISVIIMTAYTLVAYKYFGNGLYIGVSRQLLTVIFINIITLVVQFYFENREKKFINSVFKQYISPELIDDMVNKEIMPSLGGNKSHISAYFTDIASFSTFSEKIGDPSKLVTLLNEYLTEMTDTLLDNRGTLDKYEGDAIIAFFGAPAPLANHAQSACDAAVGMQRKLMQLRKKWESQGDFWPKVVHDMHMRIGINSGDIVTGNMGSTMRKNYTMMGDAVNLAARLESAAKQYGAYVQISEDTEKMLVRGKFIYRSLDTVRVVGKSQPVKTFEILERTRHADDEEINVLRIKPKRERKDNARIEFLTKTRCTPEQEANLLKLVKIWEEARRCYLEMKWDEAIALFTQCLDLEPHHPDRDPGSKTTPSHVYIKRCKEYKQNPPVVEGEVWDGVFTATEK
ncbi:MULTISPECIES: CHASE2 domain-containing protein [unclassified Fibrobacter]|uniref:CHASE2 domain-containing protein n=1 Tax=unclassified Fibrobacter TaxID=2634177 RepID=UPI000D6DA69B|nr:MULTISPECIES: CHASE2 domain-containing protein [unclassified Fibrobacter]PWJ68247.1 adenylate cyclase [Fibrobacter sp. UWR4]PZW72605.1 adenylate cyclase [Fibrobacter sp. UWR1]